MIDDNQKSRLTQLVQEGKITVDEARLALGLKPWGLDETATLIDYTLGTRETQ